MKLLSKTSILYILFSSLVFVIASIVAYNWIHFIFYNQIDETLRTEKLLIEEQINHNDDLPDFRTVFGHLIQVTVFNSPNRKFESIKDTTFYDPDEKRIVSHRQLIAENTSQKKKGYIITLYKPLDLTQNLITTILITIAILFMILMALLIILNYFISRRVWRPFHRTLLSLRSYEINQEGPLDLPDTNTSEFKLLNNTLQKMAQKIRRDYLNLKEFNENASHELQTPLAIIKAKLDLLIQNSQLTVEQMKLINGVYEATSRMTKMNHGLLLISRIDNNQFDNKEEIDLLNVIDKQLENLAEILLLKELSVNKNYRGHTMVVMNRILCEIMISNLLSNAVKHNKNKGIISISLEPGILTISNTGQELSVPPRMLFTRFVKHESNSDSIGMGMSIVKKITDLNHFRICYSYENAFHQIRIDYNSSHI